MNDNVDRIIRGIHADPFSYLGPHPEHRDGTDGIAVRTFQPGASDVWVTYQDRIIPAVRIHEEGLYEAWIADRPAKLRYKIRVRFGNSTSELSDPYSFWSTFTDFDLHLLREGTHYRNYEKLGSHLHEVDGVRGVLFAVWAPNAKRVSIVGDFNMWDGRRHPMRFHPGVGIWELFVPGLTEGTVYKYEILAGNYRQLPLRADPYAFFCELRPNTGSIVCDTDHFEWNDKQWLANRKSSNALAKPLLIYEVHLGSWARDPSDPTRFLTYAELADRLSEYVKMMGFTHIELLPISEHPFDGSWGYQTLGYFAPTSRFGTPQEFAQFVDRMHQAGIGVIIDWVPAHFPRDAHGLRQFDGTSLYEHADPRQAEHPEWGTLIFNYGRNEVANFLLGNALFWLDRYHIDGIRVDAVASMLYLDYGRKEGQWIPNRYGGRESLEAIEFLKRMNELIYSEFPGTISIAEESTAWPLVSKPTYLGGLGFSFKWNMGWMNDTLRYMHLESIHRKYHHQELTFSIMYAFTENFVLPLSHDEVVHGKGPLWDKMPGDEWQKFANLRLLFGYMYGHPGKKLLFMGGEISEPIEWRFQHSVDWHLLEKPAHRGMQLWVKDLNHLLTSHPCLYEHDYSFEGFQWIDCNDYERSTLSFIRRAGEEILIFVCNFTPVVRENFEIGVPRDGMYQELLNSDATVYGGSGLGNAGRRKAEAQSWREFPATLTITLPALAVLVFKPE